MSSRKITTLAERVDQMVAAYAKLDHEAHELIDLHIAELRAECPGTPFGVLKQCEITARAGTTLNVPAALRLLRDRRLVRAV
jgi:hypothetical protein